ncbi:hypothetical protein PF003_g78 [Phytophthora fragariae]|nr:hypothetical protein PF003_g78 [Phytophthora fragariae]
MFQFKPLESVSTASTRRSASEIERFRARHRRLCRESAALSLSPKVEALDEDGGRTRKISANWRQKQQRDRLCSEFEDGYWPKSAGTEMHLGFNAFDFSSSPEAFYDEPEEPVEEKAPAYEPDQLPFKVLPSQLPVEPSSDEDVQQRQHMTEVAKQVTAMGFNGAISAQTLRSDPGVSTLSPADEAVIPEVDETVSVAQREVFGIALAALVIFVAAGGGTGGGGVLDPIYILVCGLSAKTAIPLSSITILGGAFGNLFLNLRRTRDDSTTPLIDWDVILVMQPLLLLGATCGTYLNTVLPTWLLCVLLVLVLSLTGTRTLQKAISARQKEHWQCCVSPESTSLLGIEKTSTHEKTQADVPWRKLATLMALFAVIAGMRILRGGKNFDSPLGIDSSSALYPALVAMPYAFLVGISYFSLKNLSATYEKQQNPEYELEAHEIKWTPSSIRFFPFFSLAAGAVSGMFGIDGGIINGPLLLEVGIDASAASAMTATTVLFSSGMSAFNYMVMGKMDMHLAQLLLPMGFLMTYIGQLCLLKIVRRFQCPSLIIFSMAVIVLISAVAMSIESVRALLV